MVIALIQIIFFFILIYQDFRYRSVSIWLLVTLGGSAILKGVLINGCKQLLSFLSMNFLFLLLILGSVLLYYFVKTHKLQSPFVKLLGWGDIIFFFLLGLMFSPVNFVVLFVVSLLFSLLITLLVRLFNVHWATVPLIGTMGLFFVPVLLCCVLTGSSSYSDRQLMILILPLIQ
jgi:hypothetical protein